MIDISAPVVAVVDWVTTRVREIGPEIAGGFIAYCLHLVYHEVWKKPGHFLIRRLRRKPKPANRKEL